MALIANISVDLYFLFLLNPKKYCWWRMSCAKVQPWIAIRAHLFYIHFDNQRSKVFSHWFLTGIYFLATVGNVIVHKFVFFARKIANPTVVAFGKSIGTASIFQNQRFYGAPFFIEMTFRLVKFTRILDQFNLFF